MSQPVYRNAIILNYDSVTRSRRSRDSKASYLLTSSNRTREDDIFSWISLTRMIYSTHVNFDIDDTTRVHEIYAIRWYVTGSQIDPLANVNRHRLSWTGDRGE